MLGCYMDDSADHGRKKIFSVGGFVGSSEEWFKVERYWARVLKREDIDYFRTYEIRGAMPSLEELKGTPIVILLIHPLIEQKTQVIRTKLVEIENHGIWLEGEDLANYLHDYVKEAIIPKMPLFFVPFAQIAWITGSADYPSLSEKRLGV